MDATFQNPVAYNGDALRKGLFIVHENSLWFNKMVDNDTVPSLENKSYDLIIKSPKTPEHKGLYDEGETYEHLDIVMKNNSAWMKTPNPAQALPSDGWKLLAKEGGRGKKGDKGDVGDMTELDHQVFDDIGDRLLKIEGKLDADQKKHRQNYFTCRTIRIIQSSFESYL